VSIHIDASSTSWSTCIHTNKINTNRISLSVQSEYACRKYSTISKQRIKFNLVEQTEFAHLTHCICMYILSESYNDRTWDKRGQGKGHKSNQRQSHRCICHVGELVLAPIGYPVISSSGSRWWWWHKKVCQYLHFKTRTSATGKVYNQRL